LIFQKDPVIRQGKRENVGMFENEGERAVCTFVCIYGRALSVSTSYYYSSSKGRIWI
jgi:hypothetical protein